MKIKKSLAGLLAITTLATTSVSANAADYHFYGNQQAAQGSGDFEDVIDAALLNIGEFGLENLPVNPLDTPTEQLADIVIGEIEDAVGLGEIADYANCLKWCYYAFEDFGTAIGELNEYKENEYESIANAYYQEPIELCTKIVEKFTEYGSNGTKITQEQFISAQKAVNNCKDDVAYLRSCAKKLKYRNFKAELNHMADCLEDFHTSINVATVYNIAYSKAYSSKVSYRYDKIYNKRTMGVSGSFAVVGMACGMLKGSRTSEYDVYCANQKREDLYWWTTETNLNLDDQVTKFGENTSTTSKINTLINLSTNAKSGLVIQVNQSGNYQLRYLLGVGGSNGQLLVLDPISGSSAPITLQELCSNYGLDYNHTVSRIRTVWSYTWA